MSERDVTAELMRLVNGYQVSQAIHVVAALRIADLLAAGPRSSDELAAGDGFDASALYRVLRALAALGVFEEDGEGRFALTPLGQGLRSDCSESVGAGRRSSAGPTTGRPGRSWRTACGPARTRSATCTGTDVWGYRSTRPEEARSSTGRWPARAPRRRALIAAYDFCRLGWWSMSAAARAGCSRHCWSVPGARGVLFDQPHVVASAGRLLGPGRRRRRCGVVGGSFFEAVPEGGDVYLLKAVLHDWEDAEAHRHPASAAARHAGRHRRVLVVERVVAPPNEDPDAKFSDLNMLVSPGGQERNREEFAALLAAARLRLTRVIPTGTAFSVIEAVPS